MARWSEGYVADVAYTSNIYRDMLPGWLHLTSLLLGQRPTDLPEPFRYADVGCGFGLTDAVVAACHPQAEVWGFDFNPAHVEAARAAALRSGLGNLRYEERAFADLAAASDLPQFDVIALHGVWSWISAEHRRQIVAFIDRRLKPGGFVYISYNVMTGWASMLPVRALMRQLAQCGRGRSDEQAPALIAFIERLRDGGAAYFANNPSVEPRLKMLPGLDARYVAHEYLNASWEPHMSADVAAELSEAKCSFVGSANLADNVDAASVPAGMLAMLAEQRDPALRETIRDFANAQGFRRDVFRRGLSALPAVEQMERLDAVSFLGFNRRVTDPVTFNSSLGPVTGKPEVYRPLLDALAEGPLSVAAARALPIFEGKPLADALQALTLLVAGGYAHPVLPGASEESRAACRRLNLEIVRQNRQGGAVTHLAAPAIGSVVSAELIETLVAGELLDGGSAEAVPLAAAVATHLARTGRQLQSDGKPVTDPAAARSALEGVIAGILSERVSVLRSLGVLD